MQQIKIVDRELSNDEGYELKDALEKRLNGYLSEGWKLFSVIPSSEDLWDPTFILIKEVIGCVEKHQGDKK